MEKTTEIQLQHSIKVDGEDVTVLTIRHPKARDFRTLGGLDKPFSVLLDFAAVLANVPPSSIDQLEVDDMNKVVGVVGGFLGKSPVTGMKL